MIQLWYDMWHKMVLDSRNRFKESPLKPVHLKTCDCIFTSYIFLPNWNIYLPIHCSHCWPIGSMQIDRCLLCYMWCKLPASRDIIPHWLPTHQHCQLCLMECQTELEAAAVYYLCVRTAPQLPGGPAPPYWCHWAVFPDTRLITSWTSPLHPALDRERNMVISLQQQELLKWEKHPILYAFESGMCYSISTLPIRFDPSNSVL